MKMVKYSIVIGLTILMVSPAFAFNGRRKGFIFGGGFGIFDLPSTTGSNPRTTHIKLGLGLSDKDIFAIEVAGYDRRTVGVLGSNRTTGVYDKSFNFLSWYHYHRPTTSSWFWGAGIGKYNCSFLTDAIWVPPYSLMISGGYEYWHFEAKLYALYISGDKDHMNNYRHIHFGVAIGVTAF